MLRIEDVTAYEHKRNEHVTAYKHKRTERVTAYCFCFCVGQVCFGGASVEERGRDSIRAQEE